MKKDQNPTDVSLELRTCGYSTEGHLELEITVLPPGHQSWDYSAEEHPNLELPYERDYKQNTLQGSASLLKVIRAFQPDLLSGKKDQLAIVSLIEKYVTSDYDSKLLEKEAYILLRHVLTKDLLVAVKGLRSIALKDNINSLATIDATVRQNARSAWESAKSKLANVKNSDDLLNQKQSAQPGKCDFDYIQSR